MMRHLIFTCLGFMCFGFAIATQSMGIKAGLGLWGTIIIFVTGIAAYAFAIIVSLPKLKAFIKEKESGESNSITNH